ncbi:ribonuclease J [Candidatus Shapirobacteria bacterium]|nr:ribonuclease J [Candidatus Shapirobacteria bacterium]
MISGKEELKILSLGGFGKVTQNMFVYETPRDILVVDCGIGFPEKSMFGIDLIIPDISYLKKKKDKIRGIFLTHGHEDHLGALPYVLPYFPNLPVFGSPLTLALAQEKLKEAEVVANLQEAPFGKEIFLGDFKITLLPITHSIPQAGHLLIKTPFGNVYHGPDFKFDWTPVDKTKIGVEKMVEASRLGVDLLLSDCLRAEREGYTPSEQTLVEIFEREIRKAKGRFIVTTMSSNISRLKTAIEASRRFNRRIVLVGRSVKEAVKIGRQFGYISLPPENEIKPERAKNFPPQNLTLLVAGSQAQVGSALDRIVSGQHPHFRVEKNDFVVFSSDYIPGNESLIQALIDDLIKQGAEVSYMDISEDLHVSGHGAQGDLALLIDLVKPKFLLPIGGNFRQMKQYSILAQKMGYSPKQVILPLENETISLSGGQVRIGGKIEIRNVLVDGLGVGDVGNVVLRDREILSREGLVVAILAVDQEKKTLLMDPLLVSRGFLYGQLQDSKEILNGAREEIKTILTHSGHLSWQDLKLNIQDSLEKFFYQTTGRRPMVLLVDISL